MWHQKLCKASYEYRCNHWHWFQPEIWYAKHIPPQCTLLKTQTELWLPGLCNTFSCTIKLELVPCAIWLWLHHLDSTWAERQQCRSKKFSAFIIICVLFCWLLVGIHFLHRVQCTRIHRTPASASERFSFYDLSSGQQHFMMHHRFGCVCVSGLSGKIHCNFIRCK